MSSYTSTKTKTGAIYYYKIENGKKIRIPKKEVPNSSAKPKKAQVVKKKLEVPVSRAKAKIVKKKLEVRMSSPKAKPILQKREKDFGNLPSFEEYTKMSLAHLKKQCKAHNLTSESLAETEKGKKEELIQRLLALYVEDRGGYKIIGVGKIKDEKRSTNYNTMTVAELKHAIDIRNEDKFTRKDKNLLTKTGTKILLIRKLEEDDKL